MNTYANLMDISVTADKDSYKEFYILYFLCLFKITVLCVAFSNTIFNDFNDKEDFPHIEQTLEHIL